MPGARVRLSPKEYGVYKALFRDADTHKDYRVQFSSLTNEERQHLSAHLYKRADPGPMYTKSPFFFFLHPTPDLASSGYHGIKTLKLCLIFCLYF